MIAGSPDPKWNHTPWTQELLTLVVAEETGISVSIATLCRILKQLKARKGRPRPVVSCPWPAWKRQRRLRELRKLIETLPPDEVGLFEDEVDIHLNPKIGPDWMLPGVQKAVVTPGQHQKRDVAGAITAWHGALIWGAGPSKCSAVFCALIAQRRALFASYRVIHLIVDNSIIHRSQITQKALDAQKGHVRLHFLPPYCPKANRIERLWEHLHARVTRNHHCSTIEELMDNVETFLKNPWKHVQETLSEAA